MPESLRSLRIRSLEAQVAALVARVEALEERLAAVESPPDFEVVSSAARSGTDSYPAAKAASSRGPRASPPVGGERLVILRRISDWLLRSLAGEHRGSSGRDGLAGPSRYYVVARDISGRVYRFFRVVSPWSEAERLVKTGSSSGDSIYIGLPRWEDVQQIGELSGFGLEDGRGA